MASIRWTVRQAFVVVLIVGIAAIWLATPAAAEPLYNTPVYNPETGSYYELVKVTAGSSIRGDRVPAVTWKNARMLAGRRTYKGVHGRLAVVKDRAVNDFLRKTFQPDDKAWIGLRYWCEFNRLQWVTGEIHGFADYANWDRNWHNDGGTYGAMNKPTCNEHYRFWPIHYWPVQNGFRWSANGTSKELRSFFVEYPTGQE